MLASQTPGKQAGKLASQPASLTAGQQADMPASRLYCLLASACFPNTAAGIAAGG
jgi:hypothetical protein